MDSEKYIGLDVHQATVVVAVMDSTGRLVMESILETEAATILQFFAGLRGTLSVIFEEGTWSAWLYDLLNPHVDKLVVCNPRKNALLKDRNRSDRIDACGSRKFPNGSSCGGESTSTRWRKSVGNKLCEYPRWPKLSRCFNGGNRSSSEP
jgi:hypothetical protein